MCCCGEKCKWVKWLPLLRNCSQPMHSWPINSLALLSAVVYRLRALQSRLPQTQPQWGWSSLPVGSLGVLQLLSPLPPSLCSHRMSLRQSQALPSLLIITTVYGNPLSSLHTLTSRRRTSHASDDTLQTINLCWYYEPRWGRDTEMGAMNLAHELPPCGKFSSSQFSLSCIVFCKWYIWF